MTWAQPLNSVTASSQRFRFSLENEDTTSSLQLLKDSSSASERSNAYPVVQLIRTRNKSELRAGASSSDQSTSYLAAGVSGIISDSAGVHAGAGLSVGDISTVSESSLTAFSIKSLFGRDASARSERALKYLRYAEDWRKAFKTLVGLTQLPIDWDKRGAVPVRSMTAYITELLLKPLSAGAPAPSFMPGPNGDVWAIWGDFGLNIEICFHSPSDIFLMMDDARSELEDFEGPDPALAVSARVLGELRRRANAES